LIFGFLKEVLQELIGSFGIVFKIGLLNNSKVLNPCEFSINTYKIKAKVFPQNLIKSWDVTLLLFLSTFCNLLYSSAEFLPILEHIAP
jgi:hypothetical protein